MNERLEKFDVGFDIETKEGKQKFLKNMITFYLVVEGTWFFSNFALIMSLGRQNKLTGLYDQINYDSGFANFTIDLGNCSSKPQTVSITSIYKAPNDGIELFTSSAPLATIPTVPTE